MNPTHKIVHSRVVLKDRSSGKIVSICDFPVSDPVKALRRMESYLKKAYSDSIEAYESGGGCFDADTKVFNFMEGDYSIEIQPLVFERRETLR